MKKIYTLILIMIQLTVFAQDPEFSQYYAAPLYMNPAFTGTAADHRFIANYRNQWPNITTAFQTYAVSYDYNMEKLNSGFGLLVTQDKAGSANMKSTQANFQYSYKVHLKDKWMLSTGLNFGLGFRSVDYNKLVFYDQLEFDQDGIRLPPPSNLNLQNTSYFDFGAGILAYSRKIWIGVSTAHLNRPNRSLTNDEAEIPTKTSIHGGIRIPLYHGVFKRDRVAAIAPSFVYKRQGKFDQLDIGTYFLYEPVVVGLWYRGIPIKQNVRDNISQDAVVVILGFQLKTFEFSYSYDITVSDLGPISGGAHELALKFNIELATQARTKKREKFIPCPTFNK
ncbi:MAG TPA: type IX secretion system membrane protein PorP/SprF [Ohtaekwangia sp.]|uniref:PorP/SprF family type IX secretion system membrane protein n=1 Tax=Ohtaekwangia sp. TaxID=2066019 RepID=UPI002F947E21